MTNQGESAVGGAVIVRGLASGFAQEVEVRSHHFVADEPTSVGGTDTVVRVDDGRSVCAAQRMASCRGDRTTATFKNPCEGLRRM